jgi:hypothetical protein
MAFNRETLWGGPEAYPLNRVSRSKRKKDTLRPAR